MCHGAFVNGWVPKLANPSETRTFDRPYVSSDVFYF